MDPDFKEIEKKWQKIWEEEKIFEADIDENKKKFFITFPYPYLNGLLHLGHGLSASRVEFIARYKRMKGYNVLWPQGWHVTGAPIVASAYKLSRGDEKIKNDLIKLMHVPEEEIDKFKDPEYWVKYFAPKAKEAFKKMGFSVDWRREFTTSYLHPWYNKFIEWQYRKLRDLGLIIKKEHPVVWDPVVQKVIGDHDRLDEFAGISPIEGYIIFFRLYSDQYFDVYTKILESIESEIDTKYLDKIHEIENLAKNNIEESMKQLESLEIPEKQKNKIKGLLKFIADWPEYMILPAFTLRPETVMGVTNVWINPTATYVIAKDNENKYYIISKDIVEEFKGNKYNIEILFEIKGGILLGKEVYNPVTVKKVPILPARFVDPEVGTGIVMSVPAHAPYDYIALRDLVKTQEEKKEDIKSLFDRYKKQIIVVDILKLYKSEHPEILRDMIEIANIVKLNNIEDIDKIDIYEYIITENYIIIFGKYDNINGENIAPDKEIENVIKIIEPFILRNYKDLAEKALKSMISLFKVEGFSEFPAKDIVEKMKIKSQDEKELLEKATQEVYSKEYYNGVLREIYGEFSGKKIYEVKEEFAKKLINEGKASVYHTLPVRFKSRYGSKVVVKIVSDQWFIKYSDPEWKKLAHKAVDKMIFIPEEIRKDFHYYIDWYKDWAFTHKDELGTPLPWDKQWIIESLSDSTIYMAFYTIAHLIKQIDPEKIDDDLFDYIFYDRGNLDELAKKYGINKELLEKMRKEFDYWYPLDLRSSAKDLIPNHLTFFIFHHSILFPEEKWPRGIAVNGWVLINGEKMSKSKGNFIPILDAVEMFPVDVLRFLLAYAGNSGLDDMNLELNLAKEVEEDLKKWYKFAIENYNKGRDNYITVDKWFETVIDLYMKEVEKEYELMNYKNVITKIWYELEKEFKWYIKRTNNNPNRSVINKYILYRTLAIYPIIPHLASEILEKLNKEFINPRWPDIGEINKDILKVEDIIRKVREDIIRIKNITKLEKIGEIKLIIASEVKYKIAKEFQQLLKEKQNLNEVTKELINKYREYANYIIRLSKNMEVIQDIVDRKLEIKAIQEAIEFLSNEFRAKIIIEFEEESKESKAKNAMPTKPAIVLN